MSNHDAIIMTQLITTLFIAKATSFQPQHDPCHMVELKVSQHPLLRREKKNVETVIKHFRKTFPTKKMPLSVTTSLGRRVDIALD